MRKPFPVRCSALCVVACVAVHAVSAATINSIAKDHVASGTATATQSVDVTSSAAADVTLVMAEAERLGTITVAPTRRRLRSAPARCLLWPITMMGLRGFVWVIFGDFRSVAACM